MKIVYHKLVKGAKSKLRWKRISIFYQINYLVWLIHILISLLNMPWRWIKWLMSYLQISLITRLTTNLILIITIIIRVKYLIILLFLMTWTIFLRLSVIITIRMVKKRYWSCWTETGIMLASTLKISIKMITLKLYKLLSTTMVRNWITFKYVILGHWTFSTRKVAPQVSSCKAVFLLPLSMRIRNSIKGSIMVSQQII